MSPAGSGWRVCIRGLFSEAPGTCSSGERRAALAARRRPACTEQEDELRLFRCAVERLEQLPGRADAGAQGQGPQRGQPGRRLCVRRAGAQGGRQQRQAGSCRGPQAQGHRWEGYTGGAGQAGGQCFQWGRGWGLAGRLCSGVGESAALPRRVEVCRNRQKQPGSRPSFRRVNRRCAVAALRRLALSPHAQVVQFAAALCRYAGRHNASWLRRPQVAQRSPPPAAAEPRGRSGALSSRSGGWPCCTRRAASATISAMLRSVGWMGGGKVAVCMRRTHHAPAERSRPTRTPLHVPPSPWLPTLPASPHPLTAGLRHARDVGGQVHAGVMRQPV